MRAPRSPAACCTEMFLHVKYLYMKKQSNADSIDRIREQWKLQRPDLDTRPMETIGRILRIQFLAGARMRPVFQRHGIDWGGFDVLATLRRFGAPYRMTPTGLYRELVLTSGAMTNRVDVLEQAGLVERHPDPSDRRGTLIELTEEGKAVVDRAIEEHLEGEAEMVAHLSKEQQRELADLLKRLLTGMEDENEGA
jgi:DNA-binding MarR family transcriptional regulator